MTRRILLAAMVLTGLLAPLSSSAIAADKPVATVAASSLYDGGAHGSKLRASTTHKSTGSKVAPAITPGTDKAAAETRGEADSALRIGLVVSLLALLPAVMISSTCFVRIIVVLSMIRHAFGMPETPPSQVLVTLALFLTAFTMAPTFDAVNSQALQPFLDGTLDSRQAIEAGSGPMRSFMLRQVRDEDIKAIYDIAHRPLPDRAEDVSMMQLVPAFMLSELRIAFRIGFVVLLPFLLIDLVVSSVLLALGMLMVPPTTISLPIKVLMFVLIDGWSLVLLGVVGSVH